MQRFIDCHDVTFEDSAALHWHGHSHCVHSGADAAGYRHGRLWWCHCSSPVSTITVCPLKRIALKLNLLRFDSDISFQCMHACHTGHQKQQYIWLHITIALVISVAAPSLLFVQCIVMMLAVSLGITNHCQDVHLSRLNTSSDYTDSSGGDVTLTTSSGSCAASQVCQLSVSQFKGMLRTVASTRICGHVPWPLSR